MNKNQTLTQLNNKRQTLQELNNKLKAMNEDKTTLSNIGKVVVGGGMYNAKEISDQIPVKSTGKIGHSYYTNNEEKMHRELDGVLKKLRHQKLEEQGIQINQKERTKITADDQNDMYEGLQYELFDRDNPHYRKIFDVDYFYKVNNSESEDELTKQQREEVESQYFGRQIASKKKTFMLSKVNQFKEKTEEEEEREANASRIKEERERHLQNVLYGGKKKGILKNSSYMSPDKRKKNITFQDDEDTGLSNMGISQTKSKIEDEELEEIKKDKVPKWKLHSEALRAALKPKKDRSYKENELINDAMHNKNLVYCEHCKRKFTEKAAENHIPMCKDRQLTIQKKTPRRRKVNLN